MKNLPMEKHVRKILSSLIIGVVWMISAATGASASEMPVSKLVNTRHVWVVNSPNVKVANTPNVTIANTPNVTIANTGPVAVQPGFPLGFQPFITNLVLAATNGSLGGQSASFSVPVGKMLVIEQVNARLDLPHNQSIGSFALVTQSLRGLAGIFFIAAQSQAIQANTGASTFIANSPIRAYVTPQSSVFFGFDRSAPEGDTIYGYITVSGYLVDSPVSAD